jgi:glycine cleavage system aminomethyltransferase T
MITSAGGFGQCAAEWIATGDPGLDVHELDLNRFEPHVASPSYVRGRGAQHYREFYDIIHPMQPLAQPRPLRVSPFYERQRALGAVFFEGRGWERPQWYAANEALLGTNRVPSRAGWESRHWSPIVYAEHRAVRECVALFDMSPLPKIEVTGADALVLLQRLCANQLDRPVGSVTYTLMLDERGGIRSDLTVARLGPEHFQIGCNGPVDLHWIREHAREAPTAHVRDATGSLCCLGLWGPRARDVIKQVSEDDFSDAAFPYYSARQVTLGEVPVVALRVSYVGELGWELYTSPEYGARLWDLLWAAGQPCGMLAAGRAAFDSLRLEKGYRLWGTDMHTEHNPYQAGLGATVKLDKGAFIGRDALLWSKAAGITSKLSCLVLDDPVHVVMGREPIFDAERCVGYVTSAGYGPMVEQSIAYGYLPLTSAAPGAKLTIEYFGEHLPATVTREPLYDPRGLRLRG